GAGPGDPYVAPAPPRSFLADVQAERRPLRIAYTTAAPNGAPVDTEYLKALAETVVFCKDLGHRVEEADPEIDRAAVIPTFLTFAAANMVVTLGSHPTAGRPARKGEVENATWGTAQRGESITAPDYVRATQAAHKLGRQMAAFHTTYDVLLTPGLGTLPPHLGWIDMMLDDVDEYWRRVFTFSPFTVWFNLTGQPAGFRWAAPPRASPSPCSSWAATARREPSSPWARSSRRRARGSAGALPSRSELGAEDHRGHHAVDHAVEGEADEERPERHEGGEL